MSDWQKILRDDSISTLDELKSYVTERFGADAAEREIDVEALKPAFDNFQMRITRESLAQIREVGDANWNQFIPSVQEQGTLLLYLTQTDYDESGRPVLASDEYHLADAFDFMVIRRGPGQRR